jgi:predicted unusual protein kinase regulating ubiquinone biosynthesis (AarF/ABC1/UbiB family)
MFKSLFGFFNNQSVGEVFDDEIKVIYQDQMLSQSELQMLQRMMAQYIRTHEQVRKEFKEEALSYPVGDEMRNMLFREHREIKTHLKKLSALQYRLKHKIAARG